MNTSITYIFLLSLLILISSTLSASVKDEVRLDRPWKFRIGDRIEWASTTYDDNDWDEIRVPARWENEGYHGYDGFAWYRIRVYVPDYFVNQVLELHLGYIDDADEVYINGEKIGQSGSMPPHYSTAYNAKRVYQLSGKQLRFGKENLIAVRVYDSQLDGGMVSGEFKLLAKEEKPRFDIELTGNWMFNTGRRIDEQYAKPIHVPGQWENQGHYQYDGYAVYFKKVFITGQLAAKRLVLIAGRIDDADQLYINGKFVAQTGNFNNGNGENMYSEFRNYFIPKEFILPDQENLVEIRVYDGGREGGIVEGTVGIINQDDFRAYWRSKRKN